MIDLGSFLTGLAMGVVGSWAVIAVIVYTDPRRR